MPTPLQLFRNLFHQVRSNLTSEPSCSKCSLLFAANITWINLLTNHLPDFTTLAACCGRPNSDSKSFSLPLFYQATPSLSSAPCSVCPQEGKVLGLGYHFLFPSTWLSLHTFLVQLALPVSCSILISYLISLTLCAVGFSQGDVVI